VDRVGDGSVFGVDEIDDLERAGEIDLRGLRIPAFGQRAQGHSPAWRCDDAYKLVSGINCQG
jgi:hypothetical protein